MCTLRCKSRRLRCWCRLVPMVCRADLWQVWYGCGGGFTVLEGIVRGREVFSLHVNRLSMAIV